MNSGQAEVRSSLRDFHVLILLFLCFRFIMFIAYPPLATDHGETGIGAAGDRLFHFRMAQFADEGRLPFRDWWSEFPPIWPALSTAVYLLLGANANYSNWALVVGMLMLAFELGNLLLVRAIGSHLYGESTGTDLAWVYAISIAPAIFMWWNFDSMMNFFFMLAVYSLIKRRETRAALAIAFGILVKFVPALIFGAVLRFRPPTDFIRSVTIAAALVVMVYLPPFAVNRQLTAISLRAQAEKPSSQTVWALLDGNYETGTIAAAEDRLKPPASFETANRNPARIPNWIRLAIAAGIGLLVLISTKRHDSRGLIAFAGLTLLIFYLQAGAWSAQWVTLIIPLTLLVYPDIRGVLTTVVLTALAFAEYPVLWSRTGDLDPPGQMGGEWFLPWVLIVLLRTGLLALLAVAFYKVLRDNTTIQETEEQREL